LKKLPPFCGQKKHLEKIATLLWPKKAFRKNWPQNCGKIFFLIKLATKKVMKRESAISD
jgi:hypothetical protein